MTLAALMLAGGALAETREDGTGGAVAAPTTELLPPQKSALAIGAGATLAPNGSQAGLLPFGAGLSFGLNTEVGLRLDALPPAAGGAGFGGTRVGVRARRRVLGTDGTGVPLVLDVWGTGLTGGWGGGVGAVTGVVGWAGGVYPAVGVGWTESGSFHGSASVVLARYVQQHLRVMVEADMRVGGLGLDAAEGRAGVRVRLVKGVHLLAWAGGGYATQTPWGGGGLRVTLYSVDPLETDRDGDHVADWHDRCVVEKEDEDEFEDYDGCPDPDNDGDGILDAQDESPNGEAATPLRYTEATPTLRMRVHERGMPGEDPDAP
ncbi:MAG: hypothetical protein ACOZNI_11810 [Myxococcota bacterium]